MQYGLSASDPRGLTDAQRIIWAKVDLKFRFSNYCLQVENELSQ